MKNIIKNIIAMKLWAGIIPLHIFGIMAIFNIINNNVPSWWWVATIIGWFFMNFVGIAAGYHRLFAHGSFKVSKLTKRFILLCGTLSVQGSVLWWAGVHRGSHHRHSDTDLDSHTPKHGFWHSYITWIFKVGEGKINVRRIIDLIKDDDIMFTHNYYVHILLLVYGITALINIDLFFYALVLPALITLHVFCCETSIMHYRSTGYRNYNTPDNSTNVPWLWPFTQGECWHNNHHGEPRNPNFGRRWWELDPTYWVIKILAK